MEFERTNGANPLRVHPFHAVRLMAFLLLIAFQIGFTAGIARAQSSSKVIDRIARDQQVVHQRLDNILKKMERLINRNEREGRQHTADLIRRARTELENRNLVKRVEDLDEKIRNAQLTVVEEQARVLKDLDDIFAILQDRSDLERLEDMLATYREAMQRIDQLIDEQGHLLEETRRLVYEESALAESNLDQIKQLLEEQRQLNALTERAAEKGGAESTLWKLTERLESFVEAENSLVDKASSRKEAGEETRMGEETGSEDLSEGQNRNAAELDEALEEMRALAGGGDEAASLDEKTRKAIEGATAKAEESLQAMREAAGHFGEDALDKGIDAGEEAAKKLQEAAKKLTEAGSDEHRENMRDNYTLAGQQDYINQKMQTLRDRLAVQAGLDAEDKNKNSQNSESENSESGNQESGSTGSENLKKSDEILEAMDQAQNSLHEGEPKDADAHQDDAMKRLGELRKRLEENLKSAAQSENSLSNEERESRLRDLAKQQKTLEDRTRDLMRRMRDLPDERPKADLSKASDNMAGAASELSQNRGEGAEKEQEEAQKYLEKAQKEMFEEENKYQNIRQQEVLFRVQQALEELKAGQDKINGETADFEGERAGDPRLTRRQRRTLRGLSEREQEIYGKTAEVKKKIEEDESTVFSWVLDRNMEDLNEVADSLREGETGPLVQNIQGDISDRFAELIESLKLELKRRSEAETTEDSGMSQDQPRKNPLIPAVAELLMIKRMEENALRNLNHFIRTHPEILERGLSPMDSRMLKRLGHKHSSITELFNRMLERAGGDPTRVEPKEKEKK